MRIITLAAGLALAFMPVAASAHMAAGSDVEVGEYLLDFGFAPELPVAGELSDIAINLVDKETHEPVHVDSAWVRIGNKGGFVFAGTFAAEDGNVTFSTAFPSAGDQDVTVRFLHDGETVAEHEFILPVAAARGVPAGDTGSRSTILSVILGAVCGAAAVYAFRLGRCGPKKTS